MTQIAPGIEAVFLEKERARRLPAALEALSGAWVPEAALFLYQQDAQACEVMPPLGVFQPKDFEALEACLRICGQFGIPITPRGHGTGRVGGALAAKGGIVVLLGQFREVEEYEPQGGFIRVQAGAFIKELSQLVKEDGWRLPLRPGSSSIGASACGQGSRSSLHRGRAEILDGRGERSWMPLDELRGSEGMRGILIRLELYLERIPDCIQWTCLPTPLSPPFPQGLKELWETSQGTWALWEGESWRIPSILQGKAIQEGPPSFSSMMNGGRRQLLVSAGIRLSTTRQLLDTLDRMRADMGLEMEWRLEHLQGELKVLIQADEDMPAFRLRAQHFIQEWANVLEAHGGQLCGSEGIGQLFAKYQSPFWPESTFSWIMREKLKWDPCHILVPQQFLPIPGKSLERCMERGSL